MAVEVEAEEEERERAIERGRVNERGRKGRREEGKQLRDEWQHAANGECDG